MLIYIDTNSHNYEDNDNKKIKVTIVAVVRKSTIRITKGNKATNRHIKRSKYNNDNKKNNKRKITTTTKIGEKPGILAKFEVSQKSITKKNKKKHNPEKQSNKIL